MSCLIYQIIITYILTFVICERIIVDNIEVKPNKVFKFHKFTYNNYSSKGPVNQGFNSSLSLIKTSNETYSSLFFFILATPSYKPNITFLCNNTDEPKKTNELYLNIIKNISNNKLVFIEDDALIYEEGVFKTFFVFCSNNINDRIKVNGTIWYFNTNSFSSAENFYQVQLYLILTFYYVVFTLIWVVKMILNYNKITLVLTLFSIMIPFVIIENVMRLEFFSSLKNLGIYSQLFKIIEYSFRIIKNILLRIIYFLISIGWDKHYKPKENMKELIIFTITLAAYTISSIGYEIFLVIYETNYTHPFGYLLFSSFLLIMCNIYIWYYMYERLLKLGKEYESKGFENAKLVMNNFAYVIKIVFVIAIVHSVLFLFEKLMSNHFIVVFIKWVVDLLEQSISIVMFTSMVILLWKKNALERKGYVFDPELNKSKSDCQGTSGIRDENNNTQSVKEPSSSNI